MQFSRSVEDISMYNGIDLNDRNSSQTQLNQSNNDIENDGNESLKYKIFLKLIDLLLTCFVFTPLVIIFWASTWDILYLFLFPNDFYLSILTTFIIANSILIIFHLFQEKLNNFHLKLRDIIKMDAELDILNQDARVNYYSRDFYFRCFYSYILTGAYVCAWKTYWELYTHFTDGLNWPFFLLISIIALIFYRFGLKRSIDNFTRTVPFYLFMDIKFEQTFLQPKRIFLNNVIIIIYNE
jgi:hypothetical protein